MTLEFILIFLLLGAFVGFAAGLLGIGGGGLMVPILTSTFLLQGIPANQVLHLALGTSMASIIVTSFSSMSAHKAKGSISWPIFRTMVVGVLTGTFLATFIVSHINSIYLAIFFAVFMFYVSMQMFFSRSFSNSGKSAGRMELLLAGCGIGSLSALVSIGGGSLTVPYLTMRNVNPLKAIGTSAAIGLPISIAGTLGYLMSGWSNTNIEHYTLGYIYLPAVVLISLVSYFFAPLGVRCAHKLPVHILKKIFAVLLFLLSIDMLISITMAL